MDEKSAVEKNIASIMGNTKKPVLRTFRIERGLWIEATLFAATYGLSMTRLLNLLLENLLKGNVQIHRIPLDESKEHVA